jgi:pimeloyl-ACP methyl ester carboxylesterase
MANENPVIVIVHGAWHRPSHFTSIIDPLCAKGYTVLAPSNATAGLDDSVCGTTHLDDVRLIHEALLPYLDAGKEAVIVCHSYGGIPGTASVEGQTIGERSAKGLKGGIKAMVYITSFALPQRGMSLFNMIGNKYGDWIKPEVSLLLCVFLDSERVLMGIGRPSSPRSRLSNSVLQRHPRATERDARCESGETEPGEFRDADAVRSS